jgi:uncharacterized protein (DUF305 family)
MRPYPAAVVTHKRGQQLSSLVVAACLALLGGCSLDSDDGAPAAETAPNVVQPGAPGQPSRTLSPDEIDEVVTTPYTSADVEFMQGMIHHHAQAVLMSGWVPARTRNGDLPLLAERIRSSQESEIEQMQRWLVARDEEAPEAHIPHGHAHGPGGRQMPGMLTAAQLERLRTARGAAFDRLFLRSMIRHHRGALTMVSRLYARDGGLEPEIDAFARHVVADQEAEISRMEGLLTRLG